MQPEKRRHREPTEWLRHIGARRQGPTTLSHATYECAHSDSCPEGNHSVLPQIRCLSAHAIAWGGRASFESGARNPIQPMCTSSYVDS